ncbi:FecR family protein [Novosphingobium sp. ZW T3_23]|uniref:FecR family protein n=1 Tax=Novosphingobium sp. ZW T3_23 TaxID=3378084 RepID=UPI0038522E07
MRTESGGGPLHLTDQLNHEAAVWFARMRGPDRDEFEQDFEAWLQANPLHPIAYQRAGEVFAIGRFLAAEHSAQRAPANDNPWAGKAKWFALAAILAIALIMGAFVIKGLPQLEGAAPAPRTAANGQQRDGEHRARYAAGEETGRSIKLADGSAVTLEPGSILTVAFRPDRRELGLESGQARFDVAHEARPFVVTAGGGSVTARGTIFEVQVGANRQVTVNLVRGAIDVERPRLTDGSLAAFSRLEPGESLAFTAASGPSPSQLKNGTMVSSASRDRQALPRVFDRTPLYAVIAETRASSGRTIHLSNPSIGQLRVSGRFRIDDSELVADRLSALFGLEIERDPSGEVTLRSAL